MTAPLLASEPRHEAKARQAAGAGAELSRGAAVVTSLAAGACAGALAKTTIAPLDRTKIHFQASETPYSARAAFLFLRRTARADGAAALWRGNSATMARIIPYAAIQFTAHEQWKRALGVDSPAMAKQHKVRHLVAGSLAGVTSQSATYPLDLARARMAVTSAQTYPSLAAVFARVARQEGLRTLYRQHKVRHLVAGSLAGVTSQSATYPLDLARARMAVTSAQTYPSLAAVFARVARQEGLRTLYRGYPATVLGVVPYAGVSFFTYDTLKRNYFEYAGKQQSSILNVVFGGAAGVLGQTASYPLDIVRRRMQTAPRRPDGSYPYSNIPTAIRDVYRAEGWRGFFKGLSMNWVKGPVAVGISFATYDKIKTLLRDVALTVQ